MPPRSQRQLSLTLAAVYAVLALFGHGLHACCPPQLASQADGHQHCECLLHAAAVASTSDRADHEGWDKTKSLTAPESHSCAACLALAQIKLGKASTPSFLLEHSDALQEQIVSDPLVPVVKLSTHTARGPPSALATV